jgi:hypothetical protein
MLLVAYRYTDIILIKLFLWSLHSTGEIKNDGGSSYCYVYWSSLIIDLISFYFNRFKWKGNEDYENRIIEPLKRGKYFCTLCLKFVMLLECAGFEIRLLFDVTFQILRLQLDYFLRNYQCIFEVDQRRNIWHHFKDKKIIEKKLKYWPNMLMLIT